jgi:predicted oxidoreductase
MQKVKLGKTNIQASRIILGMMRISQMDSASIRELFESARASGIDHFDHADIYGGSPHRCETLFGEAVRLSAQDRSEVIIQSKVGIRRGFFDFSKEHILDSVNGSLKALKTDYLDVVLLHRPDALVEPEEVAAAFDELFAAGKVKNFGVSNHTPGQIELLKMAVDQPIVANQIQLSVAHAPSIASGLSANMATLEQSVDRDGEVVTYSRLNSITLQAWSPFQGASTGGLFLGNLQSYGALNNALEEVAAEYGVTPSAIAVAWITRHPANMQVVLGTTNPVRLAEGVSGADIRLTREQWYKLFKAGGYVLP